MKDWKSIVYIFVTISVLLLWGFAFRASEKNVKLLEQINILKLESNNYKTELEKFKIQSAGISKDELLLEIRNDNIKKTDEAYNEAKQLYEKNIAVGNRQIDFLGVLIAVISIVGGISLWRANNKYPQEVEKLKNDFKEKIEKIDNDLKNMELLDKKMEAMYFIIRARDKANKDEIQEAINDLNVSLELFKDERAYNNRAILNMKLGNKEEAEKDYNKAIELNPIDSQTYYNRAILKNSLRRYEEAIKDYNKAIELNPNYLKAYNNRRLVKINLAKEFKNEEEKNNLLASAREDLRIYNELKEKDKK